MAGLDPAIHAKGSVDPRVKPGDDEFGKGFPLKANERPASPANRGSGPCLRKAHSRPGGFGRHSVPVGTARLSDPNMPPRHNVRIRIALAALSLKLRL